MRSEGIGARPPKTFIEVFRNTVSEHGQLDALKCKEKVDGQVTDTWKTWSWQDYWNDSTSFAKSLIKLDIKMHKIINIVGFNSVSTYSMKSLLYYKTITH
jgi:long-subunit acyl-CoA synthetase (AMP-forming)